MLERSYKKQHHFSETEPQEIALFLKNKAKNIILLEQGQNEQLRFAGTELQETASLCLNAASRNSIIFL
jgi:hypothetical protein